MLLVRKHRFLLVIFLCVAVIVAFRGGTRDTYNYKYVFENISYFNLNSISDFYMKSGMEIGYGYLSYFSSIIINDYRLVFFIISFIIMYSIYRVSINIKIDPVVLFLVYIFNYYFFMQQFMQIRQGFATSLVFLAALLMMKKKYIFAICLFVVGCSFHQSTFAFILFYLGYFLTKNFFEKYKNNILLYFGVLFFVIIFCKSVLLIIPNYFVRLAAYSGSDYSDVLSPFRLTSLRIYVLFCLFLSFYYYYFKSGLSKKYSDIANNFLVFLLVAYSVGVGVRIGFNDFAILSTRLSEFFLFSEIFLISYIFTIKRNNLIYLIAFFVYLILQTFIIYNQLGYVFFDYFKDI